MPTSGDGRRRLVEALRVVDEPVDDPAPVYWWDVDEGAERVGTLYGWADDDERRALIFARLRGDGEHVWWVPARLVRRRRE